MIRMLSLTDAGVVADARCGCTGIQRNELLFSRCYLMLLVVWRSCDGSSTGKMRMAATIWMLSMSTGPAAVAV